MKKDKVLLAAMAAAGVVFGGTAMGGDTQTLNTSDAYVSTVVTSEFVPKLGSCTAPANGTGNCNAQGTGFVTDAAGLTATSLFTDVVPAFDSRAASGFFLDQNLYSSGLFRDPWGSYFDGLDLSWGNITVAQSSPWVPMGMYPGGGASFQSQVVVGYIQAWESLGGADNFAQNFRSQFAMDFPFMSPSTTEFDQRVEQSVELGQGPYEASRQTFATIFDHFKDTGPNPDENRLAFLIAQDVEGYFWSCINCDTPELIATGAEHAFAPFEMKDALWGWDSAWHTVPTISHGTHGPLSMTE